VVSVPCHKGGCKGRPSPSKETSTRKKKRVRPESGRVPWAVLSQQVKGLRTGENGCDVTMKKKETGASGNESGKD